MVSGQSTPTGTTSALQCRIRLGDLLCAVPAWRSLRAALPQAQVTDWSTLGADFERYSAYLDNFIVPGYPSSEVSPQVTKLPAFFASVQGNTSIGVADAAMVV